MDKISQKELATIKKFCGEVYSKRLSVIQNRKSDNMVRIVNTGMVSSGKSSLYNMLINSSDEYFPTGAARTTMKADYFDYNYISYVDTPGIDVRSEDDALAFSTIIESDIILMIHNIRTGPLNRSEVEWLERITRSMNSVEMCRSRIVFVVSWKDTREKEGDYGELIGNIKRQVFDIIGGEIPFFDVSVKKYQQGMEKEKDVLMQNSGIPELKSFLEEYALSYLKKKQELDAKEQYALLKEIRGILQDTRVSKTREMQIRSDNVRSGYRSKMNAWKHVYDFFSSQRHKLTDLERELRNI